MTLQSFSNSLSMAEMDLRMAYLRWLSLDEAEIETEIQQFRDYYAGNQRTFLTDRLKEFLNLETKGDDEINLALNICKPIVNAVVERLVLTRFHSQDDKWADYMNRVWQESGMDAMQHANHLNAVRDREGFVIVDFDADTMLADLTPQRRFVSGEFDGDNFGCKVKYQNDDPTQKMLWASKRWTEWIAPDYTMTRQRLTLYFDDRIEKYVDIGGTIEPIMDEADESWPIEWLDNDGLPLGIPVFHFMNPDLLSELNDAVPLQDATNKSFLDMLAAADQTAFQFFVTIGWIPTSDGKELRDDESNAAVIQPGRVLGTDLPPSEAGFQTVPPADIKPILEVVTSCIIFAAMVTDTPVGRFQAIRQVAAEGTLKEQETPLISKVELRQSQFGAVYRRMMRMVKKLANLFGEENFDDKSDVRVAWKPAEVRSAKEKQDEWTVKRQMGVPSPQLWLEMGYTPDQVDEFKKSDEYLARIAMIQAGAQNMAQNQPGDATAKNDVKQTADTNKTPKLPKLGRQNPK